MKEELNSYMEEKRGNEDTEGGGHSNSNSNSNLVCQVKFWGGREKEKE